MARNEFNSEAWCRNTAAKRKTDRKTNQNNKKEKLENLQ